jgi:N-acetylglucosaminyl-diphospho-decaprenol L-rhamnosyltransferase
MNLSIIVLNWNSKRYLEKCIGSINENVSSSIKKEIIIVDNGSRDGSVEFIKEHYQSGIMLIKNDRNRGVAFARNQGICCTNGMYVLMLDVDTIVHEGAIETLINTLDKDNKIGLCGPKLFGIDGELQYSCREFPTILSKLYRQFPPKWQNRLLIKEELRSWDHGSIKNVGYIIGACQLIRREAIKDVGLFDENMFYGVEDVDFCLRTWKNGWKVVYNPFSQITHFEQRYSRKLGFNPLIVQHIYSLLIYFWKHKYVISPPNNKGCMDHE